MANDRIAELLAPDYLAGLSALPIEGVRSRRSDCQAVEVSLSYLRRMVQGRLDIVLAELKRRQEGDTVHDLSSLVDQLPTILGEHVHAPGNGRLSPLTVVSDPTVDEDLVDQLDQVADANCLSGLPTTSDDEVRALIDRLTTFEREVSGQRRALHERIDALQEELVRRYQSGEATVDSLLR